MQPEWIAAGIFLLGNTVRDIRKKEIAPVFTAVFFLFGLMISVTGERSPADAAAALVPGAGFLAIGLVSGGAVGPGDGIALAVTGLYLPAAGVAEVCFLGVLFSACAAGILFIKNRRGKDRLPFLPFLFAGCLAAMAGKFLTGV